MVLLLPTLPTLLYPTLLSLPCRTLPLPLPYPYPYPTLPLPLYPYLYSTPTPALPCPALLPTLGQLSTRPLLGSQTARDS